MLVPGKPAGAWLEPEFGPMLTSKTAASRLTTGPPLPEYEESGRVLSIGRNLGLKANVSVVPKVCCVSVGLESHGIVEVLEVVAVSVCSITI